MCVLLTYGMRISYLYLRLENSDVDRYEQEIEKKINKIETRMHEATIFVSQKGEHLSLLEQ